MSLTCRNTGRCEVTYFVAWLVLDERRIEANRRDGILCCFKRGDHGTSDLVVESEVEDGKPMETNAFGIEEDEKSKDWIATARSRLTDWAV